MNQKFSYKKAGVDIETAEKALSRLKTSIAETHNKNVLKNIGAFGGFYQFPINEYKNPILISSTDGVGTKLKVAVMMNKHDTVGQDLVNHCINDIAVCGATPLFFLDYFGCGKLSASVYHDVIMGFVKACRTAKLPLIGGETAEMPDVYHPGEYDWDCLKRSPYKRIFPGQKSPVPKISAGREITRQVPDFGRRITKNSP